MENTLTVHSLVTKYLAWCQKHRSPRTHEWYTGHLDNFIRHLGDARDSPALELKPYHVIEWIDAQTGWGDNYARGAIVAVQRAYNWADELGYISGTPLRRIKKPPAKSRDAHMTPEDFEQLMGLLKPGDPFQEFFLFVWLSGCRPQEARHIEARHVELGSERIVFPAEESKGKRTKRVIYLQGPTLEIIARLYEARPEGKLFRNQRGLPWSKFAVCNRFYRLSQKTGKRMHAYLARHGFCQRKLIQGHSLLVVSQLMGHRDTTMVSRVYSHLDKAPELLKKALVE